MKLLDTHIFKPENYGTRSANYDCKIDWNNFKKNLQVYSLRKKYSFLLIKTLFKEYYPCHY